MNRTKLKNYAPQARRDFIQAVTDRAATYGLTAKKTEPMTEKGDVVLIGGKAFPKSVGEKRRKLESRIAKDGFGQTMEALAYLWFNRFAAIRYMELHGYLDHGFRVLSHPEGHPQPEILEKAQHVTLPGLDSKKVLELKLDGTKEEELYRFLLTAQCNALHSAMPFLFERIEDETELLLPDNLLHSDSLIRKLVNEIDEGDWKEVEIIGWLYQFYISERKEEVIGKVVASEDIPAATQLFTPNWIVKYLVQNTLGRQWLATYPESSLRQQMEYYIEPAEQTPEVQEQLKAITPTSLNPEELTLLDPACGSGHILVEAYDLFKAIYQERGYRAKDIPALILHKNLFGLEIDDRAAQLAAFALMMKARADDRRIFESEAKPNIISMQESKGLDAATITSALNSPINKDDAPRKYLFEEIEEEEAGLFSKKVMAQKRHFSKADIAALVNLFEDAKTFGSLIQVPKDLAAKLPEIEERLDEVLKNGDLTHVPAHGLKPLIQQAQRLIQNYSAVVANPPYMGSKYFGPQLKQYVNNTYATSKADLYACFLTRNLSLVAENGFVGMITIPNWMFLSAFKDLREIVLTKHTIDSFVHNGRGVFGSDFGSCSFVLRQLAQPDYCGVFKRLFQKQGSVAGNNELDSRFLSSASFSASSRTFQIIPNSPIAYWVSKQVRHSFENGVALGTLAKPRVGQNTGDNDRFLRKWHEVSWAKVGIGVKSLTEAASSLKKWFPYNKGGEYRRWYGNIEYVINWENDGAEVKKYAVTRNGGKHWSRYIQNLDFMFLPSLTWTTTSSSYFGIRHCDAGSLFDVKGSSCFATREQHYVLLGLLSSKPASAFLACLNPSIEFQTGNIAAIPVLLEQICSPHFSENVDQVVQSAVALARLDWDSNETSWAFGSPSVLSHKNGNLRDSFAGAFLQFKDRFTRMKQLEEENNRLFIEAYCLQDELSPEVPDDQVTLYRPDSLEDTKRLLSYAVGCIMGRYSLDKPGLIYAHSGNQGFDPSQYQTFRADDDGIIPLLDNDWGIRDDATNRIIEFVGVAWSSDHLDENLKFIADSLDPDSKENARDTIRHYLSTGFYKHHLSMYKKRPIYWLFSSGKQKAFQCLVYLHRYNEGTLSRMRTEYVIPLLGKMNGRLQQLDGDITASSASLRRKLEKERDTLKKQLAELQEFDARLRHYADLRITLDLDDGVKVNYGKFSDPKIGDILAEVKAICGTKDED